MYPLSYYKTKEYSSTNLNIPAPVAHPVSCVGTADPWSSGALLHMIRYQGSKLEAGKGVHHKYKRRIQGAQVLNIQALTAVPLATQDIGLFFPDFPAALQGLSVGSIWASGMEGSLRLLCERPVELESCPHSSTRTRLLPNSYL